MCDTNESDFVITFSPSIFVLLTFSALTCLRASLATCTMFTKLLHNLLHWRNHLQLKSVIYHKKSAA